MLTHGRQEKPLEGPHNVSTEKSSGNEGTVRSGVIAPVPGAPNIEEESPSESSVERANEDTGDDSGSQPKEGDNLSEQTRGEATDHLSSSALLLEGNGGESQERPGGRVQMETLGVDPKPTSKKEEGLRVRFNLPITVPPASGT